MNQIRVAGMFWDIWQEPWAKNSFAVHLFLWLVTNANTEDEDYQGLIITRGQILVSIRGLSNRTGISEQSVRTALRQLCLTRHITQQPTRKKTIINICNYDGYMIENFQPNTASNTSSNTHHADNTKTTNDDNLQIVHTQQSLPVKAKNNRSSTFSKPTLEDCISYASEKSYHWDVGRFFDYYEACGWKVGNKPMKDWKAAMRNWNRRETEKSLSVTGQNENNRYGITFSGNTCEQKSKESLFKIIRRLDQE